MKKYKLELWITVGPENEVHYEVTKEQLLSQAIEELDSEMFEVKVVESHIEEVEPDKE